MSTNNITFEIIRIAGDSGCTMTVVNNHTIIHQYIQQKHSIQSAKPGHEGLLTAQGAGKIHLQLQHGTLILPCYYCPDITQNLLSLGNVNDMGISIFLSAITKEMIFLDAIKLQVRKRKKSEKGV